MRHQILCSKKRKTQLCTHQNILKLIIVCLKSEMGFVSNYRKYFLILFWKKVSDLISSKFKLEGLLLLSCPPHNFKSNIFTLLWFEAWKLGYGGWSFVWNQIHWGLLSLGWTQTLIQHNFGFNPTQLNIALLYNFFFFQIALLQTQQLSQLQ